MACGTVRPALHFEPKRDAETLMEAMKGLGTDEDVIIDILTNRTSEQRQIILEQYNTTYERDLLHDLKRELHGRFEDVIVAVMTPMHDYLAHELHRAVEEGKEHEKRTIIQVCCSWDNKTIRSIKAAYERLYGTSLEQAIRSESADDFQMYLEALVCNERDEDDVSIPELPVRVAKQLYAAVGEGRIDTDKDEICRIFTRYSYITLKEVFREYRELTGGRQLEEVLTVELDGEFLRALLATYHCIQDPTVFYAHALHSSMQGLGTRDNCLIRHVVSRCEVDMKAIKTEYKRVFGKSLKKDIKGDTHGDYRKVLLALIKE